MGKKSKPQQPAPPDYASLIPQQEESDLRKFNTMMEQGRVDSYNPMGAQTWSQDPTSGKWSLYQTFSPEQQAMYEQDNRIKMGRGDIAEGMMGNVQNTYGTPFNAADKFNPQNLSYDQNSRQNASDAVYRMNTRYMDPQYEQDETRLHDRLTAQGFNMQDAAYDNSMDKFAQDKERAYAQARDAAYAAGGQEATDELGRAKTSADYNNQNQVQDINFMTQDRSRPLNELSAFQTGSQLQLPQFQAQYNTPQLNSVDRIGAANQNFQNQAGIYNSQMASKDNMMSGLMGLGSAALMMSDKRLKTDIKEVGETTGGRKLYTWKWKDSGEPDFGVLAQENPDLAVETPGGFFAVDYSKVS